MAPKIDEKSRLRRECDFGAFWGGLGRVLGSSWTGLGQSSARLRAANASQVEVAHKLGKINLEL